MMPCFSHSSPELGAFPSNRLLTGSSYSYVAGAGGKSSCGRPFYRLGLANNPKNEGFVTKVDLGEPERAGFGERFDSPVLEMVRDRAKVMPFRERVEVVSAIEKGVQNWALPDVNGLLMALFTADEPELALEIFGSPGFFDSLEPDSRTYSILIRCCCKKDELEEARRILDHMIHSGHNPNAATFTVLISSLCRKGKLQVACEILEVMNGIGCKPSIQAYNCLLKGLCYVGRVEEAYEMLMGINKGSDLEVEPDIYSYTAVMDGFCKVGRSDEAVELLSEALSMGLAPNVVTFNTLLTGYKKEGRPLEGFGVLKLMKERDCTPDSISYSTLLNGLLKWGKTGEALMIYREMVGRGFQVEERMSNTLLRRLCKRSWEEKGLIDEAHQVFDEMKSRDQVIEPSTYGHVIRALCLGKKTAEALACLQQMVAMGHIPRTITFNNLIQALCLEGDIRKALMVALLMQEHGKIPSRTSYDVLISELNRQGRLLGACNLYGAALKQGVVPHKIPS